MMYDNSKAGEGLRIVFFSILISIAGIALSLIPIFGLLGPLLAIASPIVATYGYNVAAKGHPDYTMAMYLTILGVGLGVTTVIFGWIPLLGTLLNIASTVCTALVVHIVCTTTAKLVSRPDGKLVWQLFIGCSLLSIVLTLLSKLPLVGWLAAILGIPVAIAMLVANILFLVFLWKAQQALV